MNSIAQNYYNNMNTNNMNTNNMNTNNMNIPSLARRAEHNIETFGDDRTQYIPSQQMTNIPPNNPPPMPIPQLNPQQYPLNQHIDRQPLPQTYKQLVPQQFDTPNISIKETGVLDIIREQLVVTKEYLIIVCLFVLLSHKSVRIFFRTSIPFVNSYDSDLPTTILRGGILVILLFLIKRWF